MFIHGRRKRPAAVKREQNAGSSFAERHGIEVRTPKSLRNAEEQEKFRALGADAAVVAAYGLILPKEVLEAYPLGCINVHASMLPRWRGAAPIQRAILAGDEVSGVTIMQMDEGLDTGNILLEDKRPVSLANITGGELHDRLAGHGAEMIVEYLRNPAAYPPRRQGEMTTPYAAKLEKSEAKIDFSEPADEVARKIRAFNPFPGAYFEFNGERFKIWRLILICRSAMSPVGWKTVRQAVFWQLPAVRE